jgi:DMSO/TMAO reductase YedYZ molybdopterin-dependent catalytic subunit
MTTIHARRFLLLVIILPLIVGCTSPAEPTATPEPPPTATPEPAPTDTPESPPTATPEPLPTEAPEEEPVLTVTGPSGSVSLTMAELQAMPSIEGWGGIKNSTGRITVPAVYTGVPLQEIVALVGGLETTDGVNVVAEDGYAMTLAYDQVTGGNFVTYDPATGDENDYDGELVAVIAYALEGQPLDAASEGTLRLVVLGESNRQVTDGHWWVKWVNAAEIHPQGETWTLSLEGALSEEMDRSTFESCSSPSCHGTSWVDDEGHEWVGTPLYLVAARVDDENKHDFGGFNVELAEAGYAIRLVAADGYEVEIESTAASRNADMIVAVSYDGDSLPEKYYPLRLVGAALEKSEMVGQITGIQVLLQPVGEGETGETAEPAEPTVSGELPSCPPEKAAITVGGLVAQPLTLCMDTLQGRLEVVEITAEHPKTGEQESYTGVRLTELLAYAAPTEEATSVVFTAVDGYASQVDLADVLACADCLLAFDDDGSLKMVMPGMESSAWVKQVVTIGVQ